MQIQSVKLSGFKNIPDTQVIHFNFYPHTVISGENFTGKTTLCEAVCWAFCGCNINGNTIYDNLLLNNNSTTMFVEVEFLDNMGHLHILKREKDHSQKIYLNGRNIAQADLFAFTGNKDIFMSTFVTGYFQRYTPKEARELLMEILPPITPDKIISYLPEHLKDFIPHNSVLNSNDLLKKMRARQKELEKEELYLMGQQKAFSDNMKIDTTLVRMDESPVIKAIEELEKQKAEFIQSQASLGDAQTLIAQRDLLRKEYEFCKSKLLKVNFKPGEICPTCSQQIPSHHILHLKKSAEAANAQIQARLIAIIEEGKNLSQRINHADLSQNSMKPGTSTSLMEQLEDKLKSLRQELENINKNNARLSIQNEQIQKSTVALENIRNKLLLIKEEKTEIQKVIEAAAACNSTRTELQFKNISKYLNRVTIRLEKLARTTGELKDCFEVLYNNKEMPLLSNSERIRAALEISNLFNQRTGLKLPIFVDNAESITHYDKPHTQVIEAAVARGKQLTVEQQDSESSM